MSEEAGSGSGVGKYSAKAAERNAKFSGARSGPGPARETRNYSAKAAERNAKFSNANTSAAVERSSTEGLSGMRKRAAKVQNEREARNRSVTGDQSDTAVSSSAEATQLPQNETSAPDTPDGGSAAMEEGEIAVVSQDAREATNEDGQEEPTGLLIQATLVEGGSNAMTAEERAQLEANTRQQIMNELFVDANEAIPVDPDEEKRAFRRRSLALLAIVLMLIGVTLGSILGTQNRLTPEAQAEPSAQPTGLPTISSAPSPAPTNVPISAPSIQPTGFPTISAGPSFAPSKTPSSLPSVSPAPSASPSTRPTFYPTISMFPTISGDRPFDSSQRYALFFTLDGSTGDGLMKDPTQIQEFALFMQNFTFAFVPEFAPFREVNNVDTVCSWLEQESFDGVPDVQEIVENNNARSLQEESFLDVILLQANTTYQFDYAMSYTSYSMKNAQYYTTFYEELARTTNFRVALEQSLREILTIQPERILQLKDLQTVEAGVFTYSLFH